MDVGGDFTLEFWMKANSANNASGACAGGGDDWIHGNIILDRDIYGGSDYGDYGISLYGGKIAFGVANSNMSNTLCGATNVADNVWHHIAVTRSSSTGAMSIYVDGSLDGSAIGPAGDISYRNGRATLYPNSDPFLVIGAEKHDAGAAYPSYYGLFDELRVSNIVRYAKDFLPLQVEFVVDANTVALYHLNEGPSGAVCDSLVVDSAHFGPSHGYCRSGHDVGNSDGPQHSNDTPFSP